MANLWQPSLFPATDEDNAPLPLAKMHFYVTGSTDPAVYYTDAAGLVPGVNPAVADADGRFDPCYMDENTSYRIRQTSSDGSYVVFDVDPVLGYDESQVASALEDALAASANAVEAAAEAVISAAEAAVDAAAVAAANQYRVSIAYSTYTELAAITGTAGQSGVVFSDAGTHTDPVVGGTVDNEGVYRYSTSPAGWERLANLESADAAASAAAAAASAAAITKEYGVEISGGVPEGSYPAGRYVGNPLDIVKFYGVVLDGSGDIDITLLVNGLPVHGPTTIDSVGTYTTGLTETAVLGDNLSFAFTNTVGTVNSVYVRYEATPA